MKQSIDRCLAEYTTNELMQFHANLNALFIGCTEDFKLLPLLMNVHFALAARKEPIVRKYLKALNNLYKMPAGYEIKQLV